MEIERREEKRRVSLDDHKTNSYKLGKKHEGDCWRLGSIRANREGISKFGADMIERMKKRNE